MNDENRLIDKYNHALVRLTAGFAPIPECCRKEHLWLWDDTGAECAYCGRTVPFDPRVNALTPH